jgi:hypothetical protein
MINFELFEKLAAKNFPVILLIFLWLLACAVPLVECQILLVLGAI